MKKSWEYKLTVCWLTSRDSILHEVQHHKRGFLPSSTECSSSHSTRSIGLVNLSSSQMQPQPESTNSAPMALRQTELFSGQGAGCMSPTPGRHCSPGKPAKWRIRTAHITSALAQAPAAQFCIYLLFITMKRKHIAYYLHSRPPRLGFVSIPSAGHALCLPPGEQAPLFSLDSHTKERSHLWGESQPCNT